MASSSLIATWSGYESRDEDFWTRRLGARDRRGCRSRPLGPGLTAGPASIVAVTPSFFSSPDGVRARLGELLVEGFVRDGVGAL